MPIVRVCSRGAVAALLLAVAACGGSSSGGSTPTSPTPPAATTPPPAPPQVATTTVAYSGIFASGTFTGAVTLSAAVPVSVTPASTSAIRPQAIATATGTAKFSGATTSTINLTGNYDTVTGKFTLNGGGFSVDATAANDVVTGSISTPAGRGEVAAMRTAEGNSATNFCGSFTGTETGKFLFVVRGGLVSGVAAQDGEPGGIVLAGSVSGSAVSISWSWTEGSGGRGLATGTISGTTATGTWSNTDGQSGRWSAGSGC